MNADWQRESLFSVLETIESGSRPKGGVNSEYGDVPSLGGENILPSGKVVLENVKLVSWDFYKGMSKGHLLPGDVLINKDGAQTGKVGFYFSGDQDYACINEHLFLLRGKCEKITQEYLYYSLLSESIQRQISLQISGSAQPGLKTSFINWVFLDLPGSITEQAKIAEVLSAVDRAIEHTEALIAKQQRIKTGLMHDLLTRGIDEHGNLRSEETHKFKDSPLGRIPVEWEVFELGQTGIVVIDGDRGKHYPSEWQLHNNGWCVFLNNKNIKNGRLDFSNCQFISKKRDNKLGKGRLKYNDIIVTTRGTVGNIAVYTVQDVYDKVRINSGMVILRSYEDVYFPSFFLAMWDWLFPLEYQRVSSGSAQPQLPIKDLMRFRLLKVPKTEQKRILQITEKLELSLSDLRKTLKKFRSLKTALMQDLLTGKVRVTPLLEKEQQEAGV